MISKKTHSELFSINGCLNQTALEKYVYNRSSRKHSKLIAEHLKECEFCKEAYEGLKDQDIELSITFSVLNDRINRRYTSYKGSHLKRKRPKVGFGNLQQNLFFATIIFLFFFITIFFVKDPETFNWQKVFDTKEYKQLKRSVADDRPIKRLVRKTIKVDNSVEFTQLSNGRLVFFLTEKMPEFSHPNYKSFDEYISKNIIYPNTENLAISGGTVHLLLLINKSGNVEIVNITKGLLKEFDEEAIRVLKNSPAWSPGKHEGVKVDVVMKYKIKFKMRYEEAKIE